MRALLVVLLFVVACERRGPHDVTASYIAAVDRQDVEAARNLVVSPTQVAHLIECPATSHATWNTAAGRTERVDKRFVTLAAHDPSRGHVALGELWEEYDNPAQWHSYQPNDPIGDDCHAKAAFEIRNYRIQLEIKDPFRSKESTKPIELWRIDASWYVWDDPLDTEGW